MYSQNGPSGGDILLHIVNISNGFQEDVYSTIGPCQDRSACPAESWQACMPTTWKSCPANTATLTKSGLLQQINACVVAAQNYLIVFTC